MTRYEVEVRFRVWVPAEDEKEAAEGARSMVENGMARHLGSEVVGWVQPAEESGSRESGEPG